MSGFLSFRVGHLSHSGGNSFGVARSGDEQTFVVQAVCLDQLLTEQKLAYWPAMLAAYSKRSLVAKIDVEGFEASVLKGMEKLLQEQRFRKVIVEINTGRAASLGASCDIDLFMRGFSYRPSVSPHGRSHFDQCYEPD